MVTKSEGLFCERNGQRDALQPQCRSDPDAVQNTAALSLGFTHQKRGFLIHTVLGLTSRQAQRWSGSSPYGWSAVTVSWCEAQPGVGSPARSTRGLLSSAWHKPCTAESCLTKQ